MATLEDEVHALYGRIALLTPEDGDAAKTIGEAIRLLDVGEVRVAEVDQERDAVVVHEWLKEAILCYFRLSAMSTVDVGPFEFVDKLPLKREYASLGVRVVPGASARYGSYLERGVILMPSFVNIGARVGGDTMVDTWATVGSCAQIGRNVHLSGGVGIGGVLEPPNAQPVIVEDGCVIGSRSMITQGARVCRGSILGEGTILNSAIPVVDAESGEELSRGVVPPWSVAVSAQRRRELPGGEFFLPCVLILRRLAEGETHDKAKLNDVLREHGLSV